MKMRTGNIMVGLLSTAIGFATFLIHHADIEKQQLELVLTIGVVVSGIIAVFVGASRKD